MTTEPFANSLRRAIGRIYGRLLEVGYMLESLLIMESSARWIRQGYAGNNDMEALGFELF